ncbi:MAG: type II toxin-antitoxin system RelE/ParE family toxin [Ignavibacteria bacterium]|nr:type II toxin-antitoxin system RelE/ParE family toxin [Ignavibacteria bacterium]
MASKIRWTIKATNDLESVVNYLETEWSWRLKQNFLRILSSKLNLISIFPALGSEIFLPENQSYSYYKTYPDVLSS